MDVLRAAMGRAIMRSPCSSRPGSDGRTVTKSEFVGEKVERMQIKTEYLFVAVQISWLVLIFDFALPVTRFI